MCQICGYMFWLYKSPGLLLLFFHHLPLMIWSNSMQMLTQVAEANLQHELVIETSLCNSTLLMWSYITKFPRLWCKWQAGKHILPNSSYRIGNPTKLSNPNTDSSMTLQLLGSKGDFTIKSGMSARISVLIHALVSCHIIKPHDKKCQKKTE